MFGRENFRMARENGLDAIPTPARCKFGRSVSRDKYDASGISLMEVTMHRLYAILIVGVALALGPVSNAQFAAR